MTTDLKFTAVPFEEDAQNPKIWFVDHSYMENMFAMFRKVNGSFQPLSGKHFALSLAATDLCAVINSCQWAHEILLMPSTMGHVIDDIETELMQLARRW